MKRHQIGIFPDDRAVMAFDGRYYSVGFESLKNLMHKGTDVIVVEKAGTVLKMVPFTENRGLAFIQSQGFVSEYGIALSLLSKGDSQASIDYMHCKVPKYIGHLGVLMDCDSSGALIGLKIRGATKIGLDLDSITEMIEFNQNLGIDLTSKLEMSALVEGTRRNSHWDGLNGIVNRNKKSKAYMDLVNNSPMDVFDINPTGYLDACIDYLNQDIEDQDGNIVQFIDWLENNRTMALLSYALV